MGRSRSVSRAGEIPAPDCVCAPPAAAVGDTAGQHDTIAVMHITKRDLAALAARKITKKDLAIRLGTAHTYLCRITPKLPPAPLRAKRLKTADLFATRKAFRFKLARQVAAGRRSLEAAAKEAHCSIRTMYRYICKLNE